MTDNSLLQDFIVETGEHLEETERNLLRLEQQPEDAEVLNNIFRSIHTIKGSSEYLGLERISELSHKLENLLDLLRRGERRVNGAVIDLLIGTNDRFSQLVDDLAHHQQERAAIDDLVQRIEGYNRGAEPVSVEEALAETSPQVDGDAIEDEYDEELFGIFVDQLKDGLQALCDQTVELQSGQPAGAVLSQYEDRLGTLQSSANYMGYDKLKQVYEQWSQALAQTAQRVSDGETIDCAAFARDITSAHVERIKAFFPKVTSLQEIMPPVVADVRVDMPPERDSVPEPMPTAFVDADLSALEVEEDQGLLADFITETNEHLAEIEQNLLQLKIEPEDSQTLNELFRSIHTIKGSAEYLGTAHIAELSHRLENLLDMLRHKRCTADDGIIDLLIAANDRIGQLIADLVAHGTEKTPVEDLLARIDQYDRKASEATETSLPASADEGRVASESTQSPIYEEDYDQELFAIFLEQLIQGLTLLEKEIGALKNGTDARAVLDACRHQLLRLRSSANYMEYVELKTTYDRWIDAVDAASRDLLEGRAFHPEEWSDQVMLANMVRVRRFFNLIEDEPALPDSAAQKVSSEIPEAIDVPDVIEVPDASEISEAIELFNIIELPEEQPEAPIAIFEESAQEIVIEAEVPLTCEMADDEQSLLARLENAFDAKMGTDATAGMASFFKTDIVKELLSDEKTPDMPDRRSSSGHQNPTNGGPRTVGDLEALLFSDSEIRTPRRSLTPMPLSEWVAPESADASLAPDGDERRGTFMIGRRQTDKFRDRLVKQSIRVDAGKIDTLMNQVGELVVTRAGFNQLFADMRELQLSFKQTQKLDAKEMLVVKELTSRINAATISLGRITSELQENVMKVRMLPIAQLFSRYPRVVHDLVRNTPKQVELDIRGEETELDRMVIEQISDPLVHIIRNAVDHGIEPMQDRQRSGKPEMGILRLEAYPEGNYVVIEISDDGRGIDIAQIKATALAKGFVDPAEIETMSDEEITALIMRPGFSTAGEVTHTSGRGVGMDVVKDNIEKLNGIIDIESTLGRGTLFRIKIPLTLAIIQALMVSVAGETFTIPLSTVDETIRIPQTEISTIEGMEVYYLRESTLPLIRLDRLFKMRSEPVDARELFVVVVNTGNRQVGLVVDQLKGREEVVIKPLEDYLQEKSGFSGATILGDGSISLILDVSDLVHLAVDQHMRKIRATAS